MDERPYGRAHAKIPCTSEGACERSRRARADAAFPPAASRHHGLFQKKKANREDTHGDTWRSRLGGPRPCLRRTWLFSCLFLKPPPGALSVRRSSRAGWAPRHGVGICSQWDPRGTAAPAAPGRALERLQPGGPFVLLVWHRGTSPWAPLCRGVRFTAGFVRPEGCLGAVVTAPLRGSVLVLRASAVPLCCCPGSRVSWVERGSRFLLCAHGGGLVSMGAVPQRGLPPVPPGWRPGSCLLSWKSQPG